MRWYARRESVTDCQVLSYAEPISTHNQFMELMNKSAKPVRLDTRLSGYAWFPPQPSPHFLLHSPTPRTPFRASRPADPYRPSCWPFPSMASTPRWKGCRTWLYEFDA